MGYECLQLETREGVGHLRFARPPANVFTPGMVEEVRDAVHALRDDADVGVVVVGSAVERYFSSGADLGAFDSLSAQEIRDWAALCHEVVRLLRGAPKPFVAAIHGTAVGGGLEIALHCDVRFAAQDARMGLPEVNLGFIPPFGGTQALARLLGRPRALRFLYDGALLPADRARELGLVDELTAPEALQETAHAYAAGLAGKPREALAAIRRCITEGGSLDFESGLAVELEEAGRLAGTDDFRAALRAFLQRRAGKAE